MDRLRAVRAARGATNVVDDLGRRADLDTCRPRASELRLAVRQPGRRLVRGHRRRGRQRVRHHLPHHHRRADLATRVKQRHEPHSRSDPVRLRQVGDLHQPYRRLRRLDLQRWWGLHLRHQRRRLSLAAPAVVALACRRKRRCVVHGGCGPRQRRRRRLHRAGLPDHADHHSRLSQHRWWPPLDGGPAPGPSQGLPGQRRHSTGMAAGRGRDGAQHRRRGTDLEPHHCQPAARPARAANWFALEWQIRPAWWWTRSSVFAW